MREPTPPSKADPATFHPQVDVTLHDLETVDYCSLQDPPARRVRKILPPWRWRLELQPVGLLHSTTATFSRSSWYRDWGLVRTTSMVAWLVGGVIGFALMAMLTGCTASGQPEPSAPKIARDTWAVTDPQTGCDYLVYSGYKQGGITPRLRPDGSLFCRVRP